MEIKTKQTGGTKQLLVELRSAQGDLTELLAKEPAGPVREEMLEAQINLEGACVHLRDIV